MAQHIREASVTLKNKLYITIEILRRLRSDIPTREIMFRETCFGRWLDIRTTDQDPLLMHFFFHFQVHPDGARDDEMWFQIGNNLLRYGREEFLLLTGMRFGQMPVLPINREVDGSRHWPDYLTRLFPDVEAWSDISIRSLTTMVVSVGGNDNFSDEDAIRLCLMYLVEVGFLGKLPHQTVCLNVLLAAEDLNVWSVFPWGSYIWPISFKQMNRCLEKKQKYRYTLTGFIYPFKVRKKCN